ncbi:hypothetical protein [Streptomyces litchfieldiae]|uniref:Uncharacterized protein n=1 Tax=Streptomyces litchfieldiae TaxID=3075543 RepID=A0ABU2MY84_9ACTN|nr:hypothetical protein [Streptomyces sp. DSM 44938]MDT0346004.1 hypothetical protein [Streptomyces sp. DSM 44938]
MTITTHSFRNATEAPTELSRHATGEGTVVWLRCTCGRLRMVFAPDDPRTRPLTAGGHTPSCPDCY